MVTCRWQGVEKTLNGQGASIAPYGALNKIPVTDGVKLPQLEHRALLELRARYRKPMGSSCPSLHRLGGEKTPLLEK